MARPAVTRAAQPDVPSQTALRPILGWLWRSHLRARLALILLAIVLMTVEGSTMAALSSLIRPMFDRVFVGGQSGAVLTVALAVAGVFVLRAVAGFANRVLLARLGESTVAAVQAEVLEHILRLDLTFWRTNPPGELIERLRGDSAVMRTLFSTLLISVVRDSVSLVSLLAVAFWTAWTWAAAALAGIPLLVLPILLLQALVRRTSRHARSEAASLSMRLDEIFHGIATVQRNTAETREVARYRRQLTQFFRVQMQAEAASAGIPALIDLVAACGFAAVMAYGGYQIIAGERTVGEFMSFFTAMALVFDPLRRLGGVSGQWAQARASLERLWGLKCEPVRITSPATPVALPRQADIQFDDVTFAWSDKVVLQSLSFTARAGQVTAIVGPSGAGKSTIFALLARMADPQSGAIRLGGVDIRDADLAQLRASFGFVSQETALFDETIRDNILFGRTTATQAEVEAALDAAHLRAVVAALPLGLDTSAGPRGLALSGGQRQRVAIARAVVQDAPFLLLDEATSALDSQSEQAVTAALDTIGRGRTTLVIAHRLSTVRNADTILVMDEGRLVEQGSHAELLGKNGLYSALHRLQFKE